MPPTCISFIYFLFRNDVVGWRRPRDHLPAVIKIMINHSALDGPSSRSHSHWGSNTLMRAVDPFTNDSRAELESRLITITDDVLFDDMELLQGVVIERWEAVFVQE